MKTLPAPVVAALKSSPHHHVTASGAIIPLALITSVKPVGASAEPWDIAKWNGDRTRYHDALPSGSLAVSVAGFAGGVNPGEVIILPAEVSAFTTALAGRA